MYQLLLTVLSVIITLTYQTQHFSQTRTSREVCVGNDVLVFDALQNKGGDEFTYILWGDILGKTLSLSDNQMDELRKHQKKLGIRLVINDCLQFRRK